jgi:hypothetical protein
MGINRLMLSESRDDRIGGGGGGGEERRRAREKLARGLWPSIPGLFRMSCGGVGGYWSGGPGWCCRLSTLTESDGEGKGRRRRRRGEAHDSAGQKWSEGSRVVESYRAGGRAGGSNFVVGFPLRRGSVERGRRLVVAYTDSSAGKGNLEGGSSYLTN